MRKYHTTLRGLKRCYSYYPGYFPVKALGIFFQEISPYFNLWFSAEIVTALYEGRDRGTLMTLVAVTLLGNLVIRTAGALIGRAVDIRLKLLENNEAAAFNRKTLSLDYDKLENPEIRQHRRRITENACINHYGVVRLRLSVEQMMKNLINIVFSLFFFAEMLSLILSAGFQWMGAGLFLALLGCIALNIVYKFWYAGNTGALWKELGDHMLEENRMGRGYGAGGMDNRIYLQQKIISAFYAKYYLKKKTLQSRVWTKYMLYSFPGTIIAQVSELITYLIIGLYCVLGVFPVGSVIKYVGYLGKLIGNLDALIRFFSVLRENEPFLQVYLDYFEIGNDMYQGSLTVEKRSDKRFDISFRNVSFSYAGTEQPALKNVTLDLKVGEKLAVVGRNGSGKTTFIKLLCRLYDPTSGEILMNDFNIRKYDYRQYLDLFTVVFQDFSLLALPLGNNVASADTWDADKARRLLEEVGFGELLAGMPEGLNTPLYKDFDQDGVNLSGGEAQKVALARALYKEAPFIILDEPTAALDPIAEAEIYSRFDEIVGDKTAIYISHRLSSCRFCDRILVFDQGEIVQAGTHEELLADTGGKYYELWHAQAQYYTKDSTQPAALL